ncbi:uncharacterized protein LOC129789138 [Lutzomyia longipalpis]|uniref:uncharacterized protein LOC129789138 n=1 Tax=Lutzomyia longipalpis TaxID=7200 RepID=UPI00248443F2|nr:uncharacterized protein LOC129789138 [Lutzomyia longipalpis]
MNPNQADDVQIQQSREERRTTGRIVAVIVALSIIMLACYHAWIRKTAVLAGVIIPALIMVLYTAWVLYTAKRDKYRRNLELHNATLAEVLSMGPSSSKKDTEDAAGINGNGVKEIPSKRHEKNQVVQGVQKEVTGTASGHVKMKNKQHSKIDIPEVPPHSTGGGGVGGFPEKQTTNTKRYARSQSAA